jgi:SAM-dependent methyltransferase
MNPDLLEILVCPSCGAALTVEAESLTCQDCNAHTPLQNGTPIFSTPPAGLVPSGKLERSPTTGTPWRQANWRFLQEQVDRLGQQALILDVGAGRGDFASALEGHRTLALDVYPYPEVDIVCDLTVTHPLKPGSLDAIVLMNVLEHVYDSQAFLAALSRLLKPGGVLLVAIPFMVKIHQAPVDFVRYTHYALQKLGEQYGLCTELLEGYYDPIFFLGEGLGNLRTVNASNQAASRRFARLLLGSIQFQANLLRRLLGPGRTLSPEGTASMAPTGYHVVYRKC